MKSCEKAATICNKAQYKEASFIDKIKLYIHLIICKTCSKLSRKNTKLTTLCEKAKLQGLTEKEKVKMKGELRNKL